MRIRVPALLRGRGLAFYALYAISTCLVARWINREVPDPYLDEVFHVPQAQAYCQGHWRVWDDKLTTPPGLYLAPALLALLPGIPCTVRRLRADNLLRILALPFLVHSLLRKIRLAPISALESITISLFPVVYFFTFLFYTDLASLIAVLASLHEALADRPGRAAVAGLASLFFRQTNILWIGFVAAVSLTRLLERSPRIRHPLLGNSVPADVWHLGHDFLALVPRQPLPTLAILAPYAGVATVFLAFLRWNGGIVLGDKERHVAILHVPQLYYSVAFVAVFLSPTLLSLRSVGSAIGFVSKSSRSRLVSLAVCVSMCWTIKRYTFEHPFLLADNRHYGFYVWQRIYQRHWLARYLLVPAYLLSAIWLGQAIARARVIRILPCLAFLAAWSLSLVPAPLIEPRYYIVPFIVFRLYLRPSQRRIALELAAYLAVNAVTLYLFVAKPFRWPTEAGWQRFMW